jgi:hypothetical protein
MKKLNILLAAIALMTAAFTGCSGSNGDPKSVLVAFFDKMSKKDLEGAAKLATKESKPTLDMMKKAMDMGEKFKDANTKEEDPAEEFNNMEIGEAKINGDDATVSVTNKKKKETFDFPLKKQDGGWKVDFSMATLAKMGMDKNKKDGEMNEKDIEDMKNFNMDSLNQGLKTLDSALKTIKPEDLEKMKNMGEEIKKQLEATKQ